MYFSGPYFPKKISSAQQHQKEDQKSTPVIHHRRRSHPITLPATSPVASNRQTTAMQQQPETRK
jgi:hypothetical protein